MPERKSDEYKVLFKSNPFPSRIFSVSIIQSLVTISLKIFLKLLGDMPSCRLYASHTLAK